MVDYTRLLELMNYSKEAFDITEHFEFLETPSGILCSEEMCPDNVNPSLRIAWGHIRADNKLNKFFFT